MKTSKVHVKKAEYYENGKRKWAKKTPRRKIRPAKLSRARRQFCFGHWRRKRKIILKGSVLCLAVMFIGVLLLTLHTVKRNLAVIFIEEQPDFLEEEHLPPGSLGSNSTTLCPKKPPTIVGPAFIDQTLTDLQPLTRKYTADRPGGHFQPHDCFSRTKTAVIVAYRNRERHLAILLNHLIPFLVRQQAEFAIFVVEPVANITFNRALLMNVGFMEALKADNFTCFVFHDVDLLPESDYNLYRCGTNPRHMAVASSKYGYELLFPEYVGGVVSVSRDIYEEVNGHSNLYFGWGAEDDDLLYRLVSRNYVMSRYPQDIGVYTALGHTEDSGNPVNSIRTELVLSATQRMWEDGLSSLQYTTVEKKLNDLYAWILVDINMPYYEQQISKWHKPGGLYNWLFK